MSTNRQRALQSPTGFGLRSSLQRARASLAMGTPEDAAEYAADFRDGGFWFGVATAPAHQENQLDDIWQKFAREGHVAAWKNVPRAEERLRAWSEPETDIRLAAETGIKVYRMGVDWGRLVPHCTLDTLDPEDCRIQDDKALERYAEILQMVRRYDMKVMMTLFHHSFPVWGTFPADGLRQADEKRGGSGDSAKDPRASGSGTGLMWQHPNAANLFVSFALDVVRRLGHLVDFWVRARPSLFLRTTTNRAQNTVGTPNVESGVPGRLW